MDNTRHVIGCHLAQEPRIQNAFDDETSSIHQSLLGGRAGRHQRKAGEGRRGERRG
jgi:hypothetical protein